MRNLLPFLHFALKSHPYIDSPNFLVWIASKKIRKISKNSNSSLHTVFISWNGHSGCVQWHRSKLDGWINLCILLWFHGGTLVKPKTILCHLLDALLLAKVLNSLRTMGPYVTPWMNELHQNSWSINQNPRFLSLLLCEVANILY